MYNVWMYSHTQNQWVNHGQMQISPAGTPTEQNFASAAARPDTHGMVYTQAGPGNFDGSHPLSFWLYTPAGWQTLPPSFSPSIDGFEAFVDNQTVAEQSGSPYNGAWWYLTSA
jgi:hypothetical protein